jgi:hypothetical protein
MGQKPTKNQLRKTEKKTKLEGVRGGPNAPNERCIGIRGLPLVITCPYMQILYASQVHTTRGMG